jgi:cholesterol oxidase
MSSPNPPEETDSNGKMRQFQGKDPRRTRSLSRGLVDLAKQFDGERDLIFDVVIVGSGYGGSVAAQQLAGMEKLVDGKRQKISVCVLERGAEYLPGMFPSSVGELPGHVRYNAQASGLVTGVHEGLFDIRIGEDVCALVANGLGGGSLINAGVMLKPDVVSLTSRFPETVASSLTKKYLDLARKLLLTNLLAEEPNVVFKSELYRENGFPQKFHRLREIGIRQKPKLKTSPAEVTVAFSDVTLSTCSVSLNRCNGCGDCMTGCNVGAKASLDTNLLAQARKARADIYTGASVLSLSRTRHSQDADEVWVLDVFHTSPSLRLREAKPLKVKARHVILAAGTLGSPEILLRSRSDRLSFSSKLGEQFSCNGDNIAAVHQLKRAAHCTSDQHVALADRKVGPTITNMVAVPGDGKNLPFWIQEFAVPAPIKRLFAEIITTGNSLAQLGTSDKSPHGGECCSKLDSCAVDDDAIEKTLLVGLIGHDSATGCLRRPLREKTEQSNDLQEGTLQIVWPEARDGAQIKSAYARFQAYCKKAFPKAVVIANPLWRLLPSGLEYLVSQPLGPVLTVHPLGGCPMGEDPVTGVVDEFGRVFNQQTAGGDPWFGSLVVLDGSIIPGSLGANPSLTISALALRAIHHLRSQWLFVLPEPKAGQPLDSRPVFAPAEPSTTTAPKSTEIEIVERLWGQVDIHTGASQSESLFLELTLAFEPVVMRNLMAAWGGRMLKVDPGKSFLRLFRAGDWDANQQRFSNEVQRFWSEEEREKSVIWRAPLSGHMGFLRREPSGWLQRIRRGFRAYLCNRGKRDFWQLAVEGLAQWLKRTRVGSVPSSRSGMAFLCGLIGLASRAGEARRFDYELEVGEVSGPFPELALPSCFRGMVGRRIQGSKRLTYDRRANPWQQLTTLTLSQLPLIAKRSNRVLKLDTQFMASNSLPLIRIVKQQNQPEALLDMASFGLFMTRVMLGIHLWVFRKPDKPSELAPQRLPGSIRGIPAPKVTELALSHGTKAKNGAVVRLTRYRNDNGDKKPGHAPLVMIHGYSVSGNTFTHPSLKQSAAAYFWGEGRDVWVIDLRTSSGMVSASLPWSIEEVALVDIPAALLHIKNVTGQRIDVIAHCIGAAMLGMALLTDARDIRSSRVELGVDDWMTLEQLGALTAFNGSSGKGKKHPTVRSVVLSQKGPLLRYTEANIFRAYVMRSLRRWILPSGYQFQAKADPGVTDQLLDRLLASLPYATPDYDKENPYWPWQKTRWTGTRHRMDALYGRDFSASNLSNETLNALDDLFGPINLDTVSQTIHFVRFSCVTNQRGRGEFVSLANLRDRWSGIPTLAIHGAGNGLVDVSTQSLLETNFKAAGVPIQLHTYPDLEHQDVWIGKDSKKVFVDIERFLLHPVSAAPSPTGTRTWRFDLPWIGPRLRLDDVDVTIHALSSPKFGMACLLLVPVGTPPSIRQAPIRCGDVKISAMGDCRDWMQVPLARDWPTGNPGVIGWLAVIAYPCDQTTLSEADEPILGNPGRSIAPIAGGNRTTWSDYFQPGKLFAHNDSVSPMSSTSDQPQYLEQDLQDWLNDPATDFNLCFIKKEDIDRQRHVAPLSFNFLLGSCQYPPGLLDKAMAHAMLHDVASVIAGKSESKADFVILTGDQIYADATAGLVDPTRSDERFDLPYETALRAEPMRRIMRSVPVYTMLDDHEILDNWEPVHPSFPQELRRRKRLQILGLKAFWKYQRMRGDLARRKNVGKRPTSFSFEHGCASFYMLDTRSQRKYRQPGDADTATMFSPTEMVNIQQWMLNNKSKVKFIVSPSMILPRRRGALNLDADHGARSDSWEGYPGNFARLLYFIAANEISNVVFLSGDEHLGCVASADLSLVIEKVTRKARIVSIHASGLYAPFPFANAKPEDFVEGLDEFPLGSLNCSVRTRFTPTGSTFASIGVNAPLGNPAVNVGFWLNGQMVNCGDVLEH